MHRCFLNVLWALTCFPAWWRFRRALRRPRKAQAGIATRLARMYALPCRERLTEAPVTDFEDWRRQVEEIRLGKRSGLTGEKTLLLEPTSGTEHGRKLIPYTASLRREFGAALGAWMGDLFLRYPQLLRCRQYWAISPSTKPVDDRHEATVRIGFADDLEYLGFWQQLAARHLLTAPAQLARIADPDAFELTTALFMLRDQHLGLISVWHPSFLRLILERAWEERKTLIATLTNGGLAGGVPVPDECAGRLRRYLKPVPRRAQQVAAALAGDRPDWQRVWPKLKLLSCWADGRARDEAVELAKTLGGVDLQPKGLLATEGVVTIPWGRKNQRVCAVTSHLLEFLDHDKRQVKNVTDLQQGRDYHVLLSTGNGFRRYRLGDRVRVSGFIHATPCLDFIGRDSSVSDVVGEKLHVAEAERALAECEREMGLSLTFALLAPEREGRQWRYVLHCEGLETGAPVASETLAVRLDETLSDNFHYRHARNLGQLGPLVVHCIRDGVVKYRDRVTVKGARIGQVKLGLLHSETDWRAALS